MAKVNTPRYAKVLCRKADTLSITARIQLAVRGGKAPEVLGEMVEDRPNTWKILLFILIAIVIIVVVKIP